MRYQSSSERLSAMMEKTLSRLRSESHGETESAASAVASPPAFTIALSREAGANGSLVGRALEDRLGWPVYDRELLQRVAEGMGLRASLLEAVDEKRKGWLRESLEALSSAPAANESAYARHLLESLMSLAANGECVIVGRGAAQALPAATTLRVRLVAPLRDRQEVMRQRHGITREEAARLVEKTDIERARFVKDHFLKDPADPCGYDVLINSSRFSVQECADLIVDALRRMQARVPARKPAAKMS